MLVPRLLRERIPSAPHRLFLHIPFPSCVLFATLPNREELLDGRLGADLIGFHTDTYRRHFRSTVERILGLSTATETISYQSRPVQLGVFPIGVDAAEFAARAADPALKEEARRLRGDGSNRLLLGIDRLDYTKGIHGGSWHSRSCLLAGPSGGGGCAWSR